MRSILFWGTYRRDRSPGQRFRYEQYLNYFQTQNWNCVLANLMNERDEDYIRTDGNYFHKIKLVIKGLLLRSKDLLQFYKYDIVFIYRESLPFGPPVFEWILRWLPVKTILDFDDSIWLYDKPDASLIEKWIRLPQKTKYLVKWADLVIVGNSHLEKFCIEHKAKQIVVIPTTVDLDRYLPIQKLQTTKSPIVIGWTGSPSTTQHFVHVLPAFRILKDKYGDRIEFQVIGDPSFYDSDLQLQGKPWNLQTEIEDLQKFDIGVMPLPDTDWTRGKCGFKGIQYMALQIPTIVSPVGINNEIIQHGVNGYFANTTEEWVIELTKLIDDSNLRTVIGLAGRKTIEKHYSTLSQRERYTQAFSNLVK